MATFAVESGDNGLGEDAGTTPFNLDPSSSSDTDEQMIVFYMIPPDVFTVISRTRCRQHSMNVTQHGEEGNSLDKTNLRPKGSCNDIDSRDDRFAEVTACPVEIRGQSVAICRNLVDLALDLGPDMILWVFSTQGWAQAWALRPGREDVPRTVVQADGSLRQVDSKGDYIMTEVDEAVAAPDVSFKSLTNAEMALKMKTDTTTLIPPAEQFHRFATRIPGEASRRRVSVKLMDELNGIAWVDVELS
ncbi:hypothetical protein F53441_5291 [Fusarium austroafricanum]|uniref:Uncharacterized protein n=1 Tax=Fusarium austroafricanum TaxID=2364996 RepID=A0A8H4P0V1_9HYPO|nr:hypothetical protein F53441_5291 [Fusarium austroafricanum]